MIARGAAQSRSATLHGVGSDDDTRAASPTFDHPAFPSALGFVAGFIDIFGFLAWYGLLAAHVTGNLVFLAVDLVRGEYALVVKLLALPVFAVSVAIAATLIGMLRRRGIHPFLPITLLQSAALALCMLAGLVLPRPGGPDDVACIVVGGIALFAMGLQNTMMRVVLNNLPPTTVMTGNITYVMSEAVHWSMRLHRGADMAEATRLIHSVKLIGSSFGAFTLGAIVGGFAERHVGYPSMLLPLAALLAILPLGQAVVRGSQAAANS